MRKGLEFWNFVILMVDREWGGWKELFLFLFLLSYYFIWRKRKDYGMYVQYSKITKIQWEKML